MDNTEILKAVKEIFIDVLDNPNIILNEESTANDVNDWDSLNHIRLIVAIEKHFKIRFTSQEVSRWKNVGEMIDSLSKKL